MPRIALDNVSEDVVNQGLAEARFVRAMAYYILAEFWGEVPIVENSTELVVTNNMMLPKNTRSSIYEFIRRDLEFVIDNVKQNESEPGRVTQWSAKGLLAKLYLTMAQEKETVIFTVDYALEQENIAWVYHRSRGLGFVPFVGDRALDEYISPWLPEEN